MSIEHENCSEVFAHPVCVYVCVGCSSKDLGLDVINAIQSTRKRVERQRDRDISEQPEG